MSTMQALIMKVKEKKATKTAKVVNPPVRTPPVATPTGGKK
jgi:hypothetical protein